MERHEGTNGTTVSNGNGRHSVGERVEQIGSSAQTIWTEARGAMTDFSETLDWRGRMERHPYATLAAAAGIGYVLGGGLFTATTGRLLRMGLKLAALPFVKDELIGMAETAIDNLAAGSSNRTSPSASKGGRDPGSSGSGDY